MADETLPVPPPRPQGFAVGSLIAGRYRIGRSLGVGGAGEVFEAEDLVVRGRVAIKVLRADRMTSMMVDRLRRELALARKITHRNVCRIHDLGEHDGRVFLTMELLAGETLADRIRRGPLSLELARTIVEQLVAGLAAAHAAGVIHRDFKSANVIVVGTEPRVVVTDFGLARSEVDGEHPDLTGDATMLGTAAYMAPEQVEGRAATTASDIYALGIVMFECVTGAVPFRGDTPLATATARLTDRAPGARTKRADLPVVWETTIARCLERSPSQRFARVEEVASALRGAARKTRRLAIVGAGVAIAAGVGGAAIGYVLRRDNEPAAHAAAVERDARAVHKVTSRIGVVRAARFTSDAKTIVYGAAWGGEPSAIYTTQPGVGTSRQIMANAELLAVSSSGELAVLVNTRRVFERQIGTLARTHLQGGSPREVAVDVIAADFAPDGELAIMRYENQGSSNQGEARVIVEWPIGTKLVELPPFSLVSPTLRVSPDGRRIAVLTSKEQHATIAILDRARIVVELNVEAKETIEGLAWHPDGKQLWIAVHTLGGDRCIETIRLDGTRRRIHCGTGALAIHDLIAGERALFTSTTRQLSVRVKSSGHATERELQWHQDSWLSDITPDGQRLVLGGGTGRDRPIYVRDLAASEPVQVGTGQLPLISPDGKWIITARGAGAQPRHLLMPIGPGNERELTRDGITDLGVVNKAWAPDSKHVYVHCQTADGPNTCMFDLEGRGKIVLPKLRPSQLRALSPDGRWLFASDGIKQFVLAALDGSEVRSIPDTEAFRLLGHGGYGDTIGWMRDGRAIFGWRDQSQPSRAIEIDRIDVATGNATPWKQLAPDDKTGELSFMRAFVFADGEGYAYSFTRALSDLYVLE